jgi:hypothetical protein
MPNTTQPKPTPVPALLVYGTPSGPALTQASWFRAEDREAVKTAAPALKFSVLDLKTNAERELTLGVHEGVLKASGRVIVGSVSAEVYRRIEEHVRKAAGAPTPPATNAVAAETKPVSEQNMNLAASAPPSVASSDLATPPNPWETLRVGARVLAPFWNEKGAFEGFWLATVKRIEKGEFVLQWLDEAEFKSAPRNVGLVHPEFRVTSK